MERAVSKIIVGAMEPDDAIKYIIDDSLMITPGDREDMIAASLTCYRENEDKKLKVSGIVLSGGIRPRQQIMDMLNNAQIPVLLAKSDTYSVATNIHDLTVKIRPMDTEKINAVIKLIKDNVDLEQIAKRM